MKKQLLTFGIFLIACSIRLVAQCNMFYEGFESGSYTPNWTLGPGLTSAVCSTTNPYSGIYSLEATGGVSTHLTGLSSTVVSATPSTISWDIFPTGSVATNYVVMGDNSVTATNCVVFAYWLGTSNVIRFVAGSTFEYSCTPSSWYHLEMRNINWTAHTFDIYINNTLGQSGFPFRSSSQNSITKIHLYNFNPGIGVWDNITLGNTPPSTASVGTNVSCYGGNNGGVDITVAGGTAPFTYSWSNLATTQDLIGISSGSYSVIVTDAVGCTATTTVQITEPSALLVSTSQTNVSCNGGADGFATATASGGSVGYTYLWSPGGDITSSIFGLSGGSYACTVTDANGCSVTSSVTIINPAALVTTVVNSGPACVNSVATFNGSASGGTGSLAYVWNPGAMSGQNISVNAITTTTHTLIVTDSLGCTDSTTSTLVVNSLPIVALGSDSTQCGGTILVDAGNAGGIYVWSDNQTNQIGSFSASGIYSVEVTDGNGCVGYDTIQITINQLPVVTAGATLNQVCLDDAQVTLTGTPLGGIWTGTAITGNSFDPMTAGVGTFVLVYQYADSLGCSDTASVSVDVQLCTGMMQMGTTNFNLFPNPNAGEFTLHVNSAVNLLQVEITDLQGRVVYTSTNNSVQSNFTKQISLVDRAAGIYTMRIIADGEQTIQKISLQE